MKRILGLGFAGLLASASAGMAEEYAGIQIAQAGTGPYVVHFGLDQATLDGEAQSVISQAAQEFQRTGSARISVRGHTDTSGNADYNQALSERREQAVANALIAQGVPADAITGEALGETDLAVQTGDGVVEQANRRVDISLAPPPPAPVAEAAPAPTPQPVTSPPPSPVQEEKRSWLFSAGPFYGFNLEDLSGNTSHLAGLNLAVDIPVQSWLSAGVEQAVFYHFDTPNDGAGGRTVFSLDLGMGDAEIFRPHIGGNIGYLYGSGIDDDLVGGPEIGFTAGRFIGKLAYDIPFDQGADDGIINTTIGIRF